MIGIGRMADGLSGILACRSGRYYIFNENGRESGERYLFSNGAWYDRCSFPGGQHGYYDTHAEAVAMLESKGITEYRDCEATP